MSLQFIITNAGKAAIVNAQNTGTAPVTIASVGFGSTSWSPTDTAVSLQSEVKRITAIGGDVVNSDTIHVNVGDSSTDAYVIREIGLFLTDGTLFAITSSPSDILDKQPSISVNMAVDIVVTNLPAGSVTVGGISISNPPASNTVAGAIMTASGSETSDGLSTTKAVTPSSLLSRTASLIRAGLVRLATGSETASGLSDSIAVTPAGLLSRTANTTRVGLVRLATEAEHGALDETLATTTLGVNSMIQNAQATTATRGTLRLADQSTVNTGTNTDRAVVPSTLRGAIGYADAWVVFNGALATPTILGTAHNVSSITDRGVGRYTINFTTAMPNANYCYAGIARDDNDAGNTMSIGPYLSDTKTTSALAINTAVSSTLTDSSEVCIVVFAQ